MQTESRAFQALHEVAVAAAGLRDTADLAALVVDRARDLLRADAAAIYWWVPEASQLQTIGHNDPDFNAPEPPFAPGEGAAGRAYSSGKPVRVDDYQNWDLALTPSRTRNVVSGLAVPLLVSHRAVGSIGVFTRQLRTWSDADETLLTLFAAQVAPALEAARLTEETNRQARNFRALHEVAVAAGGLRDMDALGRLVVDRTRQLLNVGTCTLCWFDPAIGSLRVLTADAPQDAGRVVENGKGILAAAFERREPVLVDEYASSSVAVPWGIQKGFRAAVAVPVMALDDPIGSIGVASPDSRPFTREEVQLLSLLAAQVGPALHNARLYAEAEQRRQQAESLAELVRHGAGQVDIGDASRFIEEQACRLLSADYAFVTTIADGVARVRGGHGARHPRPASDDPGRFAHNAAVIERQETVVLGPADLAAAGDELHAREGAGAAIGCPIGGGARGELIGTLIVGWRSDHPISPAGIGLAEAVAGYAATVILNANAHERERTLAAEAAARSAELLAVIENIPDGVYLAGADGSIVLMNRAGREILALRGDEGPGGTYRESTMEVLDAASGQPLEPADYALARALRGEAVVHCETIVRGRGLDLWLEHSAIPMRDPDGTITGAVVVFSDVTRERRLVRDLETSEKRFRNLYSMVACGVLVQDSEGRIVEVNAPAEAILDRTADEMRGRVLGDLWEAFTETGEPMRREDRPSARTLHTGEASRGRLMGMKRKDGTFIWLQVDTIPVLDEGGETNQVVSSFIDVTARKHVEERLADSEARYRLLFESNPEAMFVYDTRTRRLLAVNEAMVRRYGYSRAELLGLKVDRLRPEPDGGLDGLTGEITGSSVTRSRDDVAHRRKDGSVFWVNLTSRPLEFAGRAARIVIAADVSDRKHALDQLEESERKLRAIFDHAPIGLTRVDLAGRIQETNRALQAMLGHSAAELAGASFAELLGIAGEPEIEQLVAGGRESFLGERSVVRRGGSALWVAIKIELVRGPRGEPLYLIVMVEDISDRKAQNRMLEYQALHDALTDLPNRTLLNDRLHQAILASQREKRQLALLLLDLNRFKDVNDTFGHHLGDSLLQQVGPRIVEQLRESDTVARLGGDEFAVVLPTADDEEGAVHAARRMLKALEEPFLLEGQRLQIGGSIGIALTPQHGVDPATLLRHADIAMYVAKRARSGVAVYSPEQDQHSPARLRMVGELREAIHSDQLVLYYQPQVWLHNRALAGVESLVRWQHPVQGLLQPDQFLDLAEETGLIVQVSEWALRRSLTQWRLWAARGLSVPVSVNLSVQNLVDPRLVPELGRHLEKEGVDPRMLKLEITETALMADPATSAVLLADLRAMGVRISIDDFGTGYSSLSYLRKLPVDELKIDRSFVIGLSRGSEEVAIIRSAIDLGHSLGLSVVAEGVESEIAWEILLELGCDVAQGYHLAPPIAARSVPRHLAASGLAPAPARARVRAPDARVP